MKIREIMELVTNYVEGVPKCELKMKITCTEEEFINIFKSMSYNKEVNI